MQHVTDEALSATRAQLAAAEQSIERLRQEAVGLLTQTAHLSEETGRLGGQASQLQRELADARAAAAARQARIEALDAERRTMRASRSWRWTAWLRALEQAFRQRES